jgi:signal transduction histidine kinase
VNPMDSNASNAAKATPEKSAPGVDARAAVVSKLLHNVAHDIRTPTTAVRGYIRMLVEGRVGSITPDQKECLEIALRSANQLAALGSTVAEAAEILGSLNVESLDLRDLWSLACHANRPKVLAGAFIIKEHIPADRVPVNGDRAALSAVLEGTLAYALDGVEPGSEVRVDLSGDDRTDATLRIELPRSSSQLDAARNESFLKLRNQVFLHGGTLTVGNKGEQSVFTISLPGCAS